MLNLFAATGHNNYAKTCRLYLQSLSELERAHPEIFNEFLRGSHTVRRTTKNWAGIWTDLSIEQILMKSLKGRSGVIGKGITENVMNVWTKTMHRCAEVTETMNLMMSTKKSSCQHKELFSGRVKRDYEDFKKIQAWFQLHNPFTVGNQLVSLDSGLVDHRSRALTNNSRTSILNIDDKDGDRDSEVVTDDEFSDSERTVTLSSPSQKLVLSSQEIWSQDSCEAMNEDSESDCSQTLNSDDKLSLKCQVSKIKDICFERFGENGTPITDPLEFRKLCCDAGAHTIFDDILGAMTTDRQTLERRQLNEKRAVSIIYGLVYGQSQRANWFQVATARTLQGFGISDCGMEILRNMGFAAHPRTVKNANDIIATNHSETVKGFLTNAAEKGHLLVIFIDDYHNIHAHRRVSKQETSQVIHMATLLVKSFPNVDAISHVKSPVNDASIANLVGLHSVLDKNIELLSKSYVNVMPDWMRAKFFDPESEKHRLMIHDYQQQEMMQLRSMDNCKLVDSIEMPLKSYENFRSALSILLENGLSNYLKKFIVPLVGDWPAQFFVRQIVYNNADPISMQCTNIVPFIGPLHISLNSREMVLMKFHVLFGELYAFLFDAKKPLARKPKPWRISYLLEVSYGGWSLVRDEILAAFSNCKDVEYLTFLNLLDNYIPLTLCVYSVVLKSNMADEYYHSLFRCWLMFLMFRRRHYDKAPLIALSNVEYWKQVGHPIINSITSSLSAFDEYPVENFHSLLRAKTTSTDQACRIALKGKEIDSRKHELHEFKSTYVPPRKFAFSRKNIDSMKVKAAEYITEKFANLIQNAGQATMEMLSEKLKQLSEDSDVENNDDEGMPSDFDDGDVEGGEMMDDEAGRALRVDTLIYKIANWKRNVPTMH
eukprot:gene2757-3187_t